MSEHEVRRMPRDEDWNRILAELDGLDAEALVAKFEEAYAMTVEGIRRQAAIIYKLQDFGYDLDALAQRMPMVRFLRKVACGQVLPEVVARFWPHQLIFERITSLPVPDQHRLAAMNAEGKPIKVMRFDDDGPTHRMVPVHEMTRAEALQVLAPDHIRDEDEQLSWLRSRDDRSPGKRKTGVVAVNKRKGGVEIDGPCFLSKTDMLRFLEQL